MLELGVLSVARIAGMLGNKHEFLEALIAEPDYGLHSLRSTWFKRCTLRRTLSLYRHSVQQRELTMFSHGLWPAESIPQQPFSVAHQMSPLHYQSPTRILHSEAGQSLSVYRHKGGVSVAHRKKSG